MDGGPDQLLEYTSVQLAPCALGLGLVQARVWHPRYVPSCASRRTAIVPCSLVTYVGRHSTQEKVPARSHGALNPGWKYAKQGFHSNRRPALVYMDHDRRPRGYS